MDQLADVHVVITVANIRSNRLDNLANHRNDNIPPGQRQRLAVEQLLQQRHHVAVICRAGCGKNEKRSSKSYIQPFPVDTCLPLILKKVSYQPKTHVVRWWEET